MGGQAVQPSGLMQYVIPIAVIAIVFLIRGRQMTRMRRLKLEQLWIVPAIYLVIVAILFVSMPPRPVGWLIALAGVVIGAAIGWQRGRMMTIHVDPETHAINQKASPLAMVLLFAIVPLKQ
ncbi:DUF1453 domain-containing protein, partial [uncultured Sphingomonas sp.]|uniref:DUF1453 domain-containing protein n=1 Tax=uncultured Sphingomonas sp. TaxID=158754 RepID=UPI0035CC0FB3